MQNCYVWTWWLLAASLSFIKFWLSSQIVYLCFAQITVCTLFLHTSILQSCPSMQQLMDGCEGCLAFCSLFTAAIQWCNGASTNMCAFHKCLILFTMQFPKSKIVYWCKWNVFESVFWALGILWVWGFELFFKAVVSLEFVSVALCATFFFSCTLSISIVWNWM